MTNFTASNSVTRRYLKRGELIAKRRAEDAQNAPQRVTDMHRVDRATSLGSLRDTDSNGSCCLPEIALFNAGHRTTRKDATHIIK